MPTEEFRQPLCADFTYEYQSYLEAGDARMVGVQFGSVSSADQSLVTGYEWDFGDGQTATDARPSHVYLVPGLYEVSLRVATANLLRAQVIKKVYARASWQDLNFTRGKLERTLEAVSAYKLDLLPTPCAAGRLVLLQDLRGQGQGIRCRRTSSTPAARDLTPEQLYQVAMDLGQHYQAGDEPQKAEEVHAGRPGRRPGGRPRPALRGRLRPG